METILSGLSVYDYVKTLLKPEENLLVVPIGNYDAHFILFTNNNNKITVTFKNIANFNKIADLESEHDGEKQEGEKKLEETITKLRELLIDKKIHKIIHKILFAGSFEFGFSSPINNYNNNEPLNKLRESLAVRTPEKFRGDDLTTSENFKIALEKCEEFKKSLIVGKKMTIDALQEKNISHQSWNRGKGEVNERFFKILKDPEFKKNFHADLVCYLGDRSMVDGTINNETLENFNIIFPSPQSRSSNGKVMEMVGLFSNYKSSGGARRSRKNSRNRKSKRMRRTRSKSRKSRGSKKRSKHRRRNKKRYRR